MLYSVIPALFQIALAVVLIAGAVLAGTRRHEHGRAATIGMAGFLVLLLEMVLSNVMLLVLPSLVSSLSGGLMASMVFTAVTLILRIGGIALLIWAVIARRTPAPQPASWPHPAAQHPGHPGAQHAGWPQPGHSGEQHMGRQQPGAQHPGHSGEQNAGWGQPGEQRPGRPQQGQPGWQQPGHPPQGAQPGWPQQ
ncbi:hypothetical protein [Nonomuraea maritima]|uniref:hypothetical protein n=1 Tax=Nonomuraea maritima TaxID=683260 RepID=UPI003710F21C